MAKRTPNWPLPVTLSCLVIGIIILYLFSAFSATMWTSNTAHVELNLESFNKLDNKQDFFHHVEDMERLKQSILGELAQLELRRNNLLAHLENMQNKSKVTEVKLAEMDLSVNQTRIKISAMLASQADVLKHYPPISLPHKLMPSPAEEKVMPPDDNSACQLHNCFDYSRCSILSEFPIYIYTDGALDPVSELWRRSLISSIYSVPEGKHACVFIVFQQSETTLGHLRTLPYWSGDGHNHVIIGLEPQSVTLSTEHRAMRAQTQFNYSEYRRDFDVVIPLVSNVVQSLSDRPLILPARRKYLVTFFCQAPQRALLSESEAAFLKVISTLHYREMNIKIVTECSVDSTCTDATEWCMCQDYQNIDLMDHSTFAIVVAPLSTKRSSVTVFKRIERALKVGAIPVLLGTSVELPLSDIIPWDEAVLTYAKSRVTELLYILRNILDPDIVALRLRGRMLYDDYLSTVDKAVGALVNSIRTRLDIPPKAPPIPESIPVYSHYQPMELFSPKAESPAEILGPLEEPFASEAFCRNFTSWRPKKSSILSSYMFPFTPWDPILPTDAKYYESSYGFRPINNGAGGSGKDFSLSLGGNNPREQFTVVMLTFDRDELLQQQLSQFKDLPYLNKILVIWNNPVPPHKGYKWPDIGVPIEVLKAERNSLNNRFLPYKEIETEAILSMDDDMFLRHDEIVFAFRVWREARDRLVGFPGRFHAWDGSAWQYNSNHSCELSMILTGAAFFHKFYSYQYSYFMAQAIRDRVDEYMNCEDIAMNFLISHLTRKPPIKVTSRWTFRCPTCGDSALWADESHFHERSSCINYFTKIYGYLPLMYTQFRADSVLFKTRLPSDKTKCFAYV